AVDSIFPEWELWTQFAVDDQQSALRADALEHTHPIEVPVKHPDEIRTIFDMISYQKGASVIHMLHDYLGAEGFRDGLRHYLKTHSYKNTDTVDLWQALEDVTKKPVKEFMGAWTSNTGFPLVSVEGNHDHLKITQSRFVANPASNARSDKTLWPIPLLSEGLDRPTITKKTTNVPFTTKLAPLQLNIGQTGFYRVDYSHDIQARQLEAIDKGQISSIDRMGLLADGFEVTKAGYQSVTEYLDLLSHYENEDSLATWEVMSSSIGSIRLVLSKSISDDSLRDALKPFVQKLVSKQLNRLGWDKKKSESHLDSLLRPIIIAMAANADHETTVQTALKKYTEKIHDGGEIDADLRGTIYGTAARKGGQKEFEELLQLYKKSTSSDEKLTLTGAMTNFEQSEIHKRVLELIKTDDVRLQDISYWLAYSFMNRHSRAATWQWLKDNWQWLRDNVGQDLSFSRTPVYAARTFTTKEELEDYAAFFEAHMEPMLQRSYNQGLEMIEAAAAWHERDAENALKWFKSQPAQ
ncbi:ERAP1-like C-terminal domain-containing protein, partial [Candidatus Saccharibacteria bacterium]|nr:ERAP1-like C-terminal domain-containing protein [Candidatus Saccharibacteria bacterium]